MIWVSGRGASVIRIDHLSLVDRESYRDGSKPNGSRRGPDLRIAEVIDHVFADEASRQNIDHRLLQEPRRISLRNISNTLPEILSMSMGMEINVGIIFPAQILKPIHGAALPHARVASMTRPDPIRSPKLTILHDFKLDERHWAEEPISSVLEFELEVAGIKHRVIMVADDQAETFLFYRLDKLKELVQLLERCLETVASKPIHPSLINHSTAIGADALDVVAHTDPIAIRLRPYGLNPIPYPIQVDMRASDMEVSKRLDVKLIALDLDLM